MGGASGLRDWPSGAVRSRRRRRSSSLRRACRLRVQGCAEVPSISPSSLYSSLGGFLGELMEEEWKASEGCYPSIPPSVVPDQASLCPSTCRTGPLLPRCVRER